MIDMSEYLSMFLDESKENLQNLNQSLLQLENSPNNLALLDEIFRVAHTLKGMSATMGFTNVADLTHEMENVLDKLRKGEMKVIPEVIDVLFQCLDTLENLISEITSGGGEAVSTSELIAKLRGLLSMNFEQVFQPEDDAFVKADLIEGLNEFEKEVISQAQERGFQIFRIIVTLEEECLMKAARAFMVFRELEEVGEVVKTNPEVRELEEGEFKKDFEIYLITKTAQNDLAKKVMSVSEVEKIQITEIILEKRKAESKVPLKEDQQSVERETLAEDKKLVIANKDNNNIAAPAKNKLSQTVRVDIERLDNLMNLVGELVINRTRLEQIGLKHGLSDLGETLEQVGRITTDLQTLVMKVRMVPIEQVFNRFPRMVRDLAKELGKEINLVIEGEETELDRTVIDEIGDPLVHLLRNAVDHGISKPKEREKVGKPQAGTVKLIAYPEGNQVVIRVDDDGKGINPEIVLKKALEKGILTEKEAEKLEPQDIIMLIFKPGFSTVEKITDISGRGVGMDVVRTRIEALGGTISVHSKMGEGSSFIIRLPLTLAIIQALLVGLGKEIYAIPLSSIEETISLTPEDIKTIQDKEVMLLRGNVLPVIRLEEILEAESLQREDEHSLYIVVVKTGQRRAGLMVDTLIGQQEIVIKSLGKLLNAFKEFAGATILGDGRVALILDAASLL